MLITRGPIVVSLLIALMLSTLVSPVSASSPDSAKIKAKEQLEEGARLFEEGRYEGALSRFKAAYELYPSPKIQFNFGQAYRALGRNEDAIAAFQKFLDGAQDASTTLRSEAQQYIRELKTPASPLNGTPTPGASSPPRAPDPGSAPNSKPHSDAQYAAAVPGAALISPSSPTNTQMDDHKVGQTRWWLWGAIGAGIVLGVTTALIVGRDTKNPDCLSITPCGSVH